MLFIDWTGRPGPFSLTTSPATPPQVGPSASKTRTSSSSQVGVAIASSSMNAMMSPDARRTPVFLANEAFSRSTRVTLTSARLDA